MFFRSKDRVRSSSSSPKTTSADPKKAKILEINLISAQDLFKSHDKLDSETYVVIYINPNEKLFSRVDSTGGSNPTWNDKFIFLVEEDIVSARPNSCVVFEIYRRRKKTYWSFLKKKDKKIGVVSALLANLMNEEFAYRANEGSSNGRVFGRGFLAFHVRDSRGEPEGILNIGSISLDIMFRETVPNFVSPALDHRKLSGSPQND